MPLAQLGYNTEQLLLPEETMGGPEKEKDLYTSVSSGILWCKRG
jgi:hypothetical protein